MYYHNKKRPTNTNQEMFAATNMPKNRRLVYFVDGGCSANGKQDATGMIVATDGDGNIIIEKKLLPEKMRGIVHKKITSNVAELEAVRFLLRKLKKIKQPVKIVTDSQLVEHWLNYKYGTKYGHLAVIILKCLVLMSKMDVEIEWQPREKNLAGVYIESRYGI